MRFECFTAAQASTAWFRALVQSPFTRYLCDEILTLTDKAIVIELPLVRCDGYGLKYDDAAPKVVTKFEKFFIPDEEPSVIGASSCAAGRGGACLWIHLLSELGRLLIDRNMVARERPGGRSS